MVLVHHRGGAEAGETVRQAAARELREEVGIEVDQSDLGECYHSSVIRFEWSGLDIVQRQDCYALSLPEGAEPDLSGLDGLEAATVDAAAWITVEQLRSGECPPARPDIIDIVLGAQSVLGQAPSTPAG